MNKKKEIDNSKKVIHNKTNKSAIMHNSVQSYFAGANTGDGFYNLFSQINDKNIEGTLYILKGGPGTGKSTLMKTVGRAFLELGANIEYFYCSSDYSSLDGVRIKDYNIAIVDGTAPHVTEASMPGIKEKIINLGEYISSDIKCHEKEITVLLKKKSLMFEAAYIYLKNASNLYFCNERFLISKNDKTDCRAVAKKVFSELKLPKAEKEGRQRKLFLKAIAGEGTVDFCTRNSYSKIIGLPYNCFTSAKILEELSILITNSGHDITLFMDILSPKNIEAIHIPSINVLITQENDTKNCKENGFTKYNGDAIAESLKLAAKAIKEAKALHKKVESFYIPCMDFASISQKTRDLIEEINDSIKIKP